MPRLAATPLFVTDGLQFRRVACDGVDELRPTEERCDDARLIVVLHGRFAFQDSRTRAIASPSTALFLQHGHVYRIRHLDGGDVCVALQGEICSDLLASGPTARGVSADGYVKVHGIVGNLAAGQPMARLAVEETLCAALAPVETAGVESPKRRRDRELTAAIKYRLERDVDARLSLAAVVAGNGVSLFHACRVFRRETGLGIHRYHQEVRLRHALAMLLDTDCPVADVAAVVGFANQAHLTNLFRRRFGTTPVSARKNGDVRIRQRADSFYAARSTAWRKPSR